jgi:Holliday junction resolvase RusA-like endonuclease
LGWLSRLADVQVEHSFFLPVTPKATQRSRCACRGRYPSVYTDPAYKEWRAEAVAALNKIAAYENFAPYREQNVRIEMEVIVRKPKTSKRQRPRGDTDNLEKGVWDAITSAGHWWADDDQIVENRTTKRWADPDEPEGYQIRITFL